MELLKALIAWIKEFVNTLKKFAAGFNVGFEGMTGEL